MGERPAGVAILAILLIIFSVFEIIGGILFAIIMGAPQPSIIPWLYTSSPILMIPGIIVTIFGIFYLISGIGMWMLKNWARILAIIFGFLGIIGGIFIIIVSIPDIFGILFGVIEFIISLVIVIYLMQEDVSAYFE